METKWINKQNNAELILFFNGWGMDEHPLNHLSCEQYDILMFYNYGSSNNMYPSGFQSNYRKTYMVSWSFGVFMAAFALKKFPVNISESIAINGTLSPIDDLNGIPENIFSKTLENLSVASLNKFYLRMCGDKHTYQAFMKNKPRRAFTSVYNELKYLSAVSAHNYYYDYTKACTGTKDTIFPFMNQKRYWDERVQAIQQPYPHYPFLHFDGWEQILTL